MINRDYIKEILLHFELYLYMRRISTVEIKSINNVMFIKKLRTDVLQRHFLKLFHRSAALSFEGQVSFSVNYDITTTKDWGNNFQK